MDKKEQINNVECNFSKQLITLYILNNKKQEARKELKNIIWRKPISKEALKSILKIYFSKIYMKRIGAN